MLRLLVGLLVALCILEPLARQWRHLELEWDPQLGQLTAAGSTVICRSEGNGVSHWEKNGIRRCPEPAPPDSPKLLFLGDSITEAFQVRDDEVFTALVGRRLQELGHPMQILNCGRSGASVATYAAVGPAFLERLQPSWTVIEIRPDDFGSEAWSGPIRFKSDFTTHMDRPTFAEWRMKLRQRVGLITPVMEKLTVAKEMIRSETPPFRASQVRPDSLQQYPLEGELDALVRPFGSRLTLVYFPENCRPSKLSQVDPVEQKLTQYCREHSISLINMRETFLRSLARGVSPQGFANDRPLQGHLTPAGHQLVVEPLVQELHARGLY